MEKLCSSRREYNAIRMLLHLLDNTSSWLRFAPRLLTNTYYSLASQRLTFCFQLPQINDEYKEGSCLQVQHHPFLLNPLKTEIKETFSRLYMCVYSENILSQCITYMYEMLSAWSALFNTLPITQYTHRHAVCCFYTCKGHCID